MKCLYLLRHAKAVRALPGAADHERPLAGRGLDACRLLAGHFQASRLSPAVVLCSTAVRTRQTVAEIARQLGRELPLRESRTLYLAEAPQLLAQVQGLDDRLISAMVVGHNPGLEILARTLAGSGDEPAVRQLASKLPTGGLLTLSFPVERWRQATTGAGRLESMVTPQSLGQADA